MVAHGGNDHSVGLQLDELIEGSSDFERAGFLQVFRFQENVGPAHAAKRTGMDKRCLVDVGTEAFSRCLNGGYAQYGSPEHLASR